jgi:hypothetical protein
MARNLTITCDQCGQEKQESNHWYQVTRTIHTIPSGAQGIEIFRHRNLGEMGDAVSDLCGEECVLKFVASKLREMK